MAIAYASSTLTLTGGASGSRLTPANIISDAPAYSAAATYAVGSIVKIDEGFGLGLALYACTTDVTVPEAFNRSKWAVLAYLTGNNHIKINVNFVMSAVYDDSRWEYTFAGGKWPVMGTGGDWVSGKDWGSVYTNGFTINYSGTNTSFSMFPASTTSGSISWRSPTFNKVSGIGYLVCSNANITGTCYGLRKDATAVLGDNDSWSMPGVVTKNLANIGSLFTINPTNVTGLTHSGGGAGTEVPEHRIGILNASSANPLVGYVCAIPFGDVVQKLGVVGSAANQYYQDMVVPSTFNFRTNFVAYFGGCSAYLTRKLSVTATQGATLLQGVKVQIKNADTGTYEPIQTTDANGNVSPVVLFFSGNRTSTTGAYTPLENQVWVPNKEVLLRRRDLEELSFSQNISVNTISAVQSLPTDAYYTADQSGLAGIAANGGTKTVTVSAALTIDQIYDYMKYWLEANMAVANMISPGGTGLTLLDGWTFSVTATGGISAGTKLKTFATAGVVTVASGGVVSCSYTDANNAGSISVELASQTDTVEMRKVSDNSLVSSRTGPGSLSVAPSMVGVSVYFQRKTGAALVMSTVTTPTTLILGVNPAIPLYAGAEVQVAQSARIEQLPTLAEIEAAGGKLDKAMRAAQSAEDQTA